MNSDAKKLLLTIAQQYQRSGRTVLARSIYERYLGLVPNNLEGLQGFGELLFELN